MKEHKFENNEFDTSNLVLFIYHWKKVFIITAIAAIVLSAIFSSPYFIKPKYKSTVIMYATASNSISKSLLNEHANAKTDILGFGESEQTEQLLQILNSNKIRDRIISKYNLIEHYDIDTTSKYKLTKLLKLYEKNILFERTKYMAVKIDVLDTDPQIAANIANDLAALLDTVKNNMQRARATQGFKIVETEYFNLKNDIKKMEDSLTVLRELGIQDYESQAEMFNEQLAIAITKNNRPAIKALEKKMAVLAKYGSAYVSIRDALEYEKKLLTEIKAKYNEVKVDATQNLPQKFIVNDAYKAEKKSYPIRWLIVLIVTLSSLFFCLIAIIIFDIVQKKKKYTNTTIPNL